MKAADLWRACLVLSRDRDDREGVCRCLDGFACLLATDGQPLLALRLAAAADALRDLPLSWSDQTAREARLAAAWTVLGPSEGARAWAAGRAMTLRKAVDAALRSC